MNGTPAALFPLVGIGASAGGLEALQRFLSVLPKDFPFALVFMQHLSAKYKSLLAELLSANLPSLVSQEISEGLKALPGRLYLSPPGREVRIREGLFRLTVHPEGLIHLPIDEFLASLAGDAAERSIAVIFSGEGTDGARGCRIVRDAGGTVYVQDPQTAEFGSMPLAVIASGQADAVLSPEDIAREILRVASIGAAPVIEREVTPLEYDAVFRLLQEKTGSRFNHYKKSVLNRRIRRRMHLHGISAVQDYLDLLARQDAEAASLAADLLIGVTSFFRDRVAWKVLRNEVVRKLATGDADDPVRAWAPASATGEEAYSLAMMLAEELSLTGKKRDIQIFATDVNGVALEKAREGKYPASISVDVPPEYLRKYFTSSEDGHALAVNKEIREHVVFAKQDLLTDPPFSRLDLIICRNFLIYLEPDAQEKCIALFHYALRDGGWLFLGNAETVGKTHAYFKSVGRKQCRVYQKVETTPASRQTFSVPYAAERAAAPGSGAAAARQSPAGIAQEFLLEEYTPAAVAIDQNYDIIYHSGPTNRYLRQPRGVPTQNLFLLLPETLRTRIRSAVYRTGQAGKPVSIGASVPGGDDRKRPVTLRVSKVRENLHVVVFQEKGGPVNEDGAVPLDAGRIDETALFQLESELSATRQDLQSHIEQLKSLNEELQSSNEELQAANEELETSREELQSLNEELVIVNSQLQAKIEEQDETNNDLNNFLASTNIPTMFLDRHFRVKRYTPAIHRLIKLLPSDVGRPIVDMSQEHLGPDLVSDAQAVLDSLVPIKKEILIGDRWHVRATLPYRTADSRIAGVVVTYNDVTELKTAEERTRRLATFPQFNPNPVLEVNSAGVITYCNAATRKVLEALGRNADDHALFLPADIDGMLEGLEQNIEETRTREVAVADRIFEETIYVSPRFSTVRIYAFDITERKHAERLVAARLRLAENAYKGALSADDVLRRTLDELEVQTGSKIGFYHFLDEDQETLSLQNWSTNTLATLCSAEGKGSHYNVSQAGVWVDCIREKRPVIHNDYASLPHKKGMPAGHAPVVRELVVPLFRGGKIVAIIGVGNRETDYTAADIETVQLLGDFSWEIVERKRTEEELRKDEERLERSQEIAHLGSWELDLAHNALTWSDEVYRIFGLKPREFGATYDAFLEGVHPDDRAAVDAAYAGSLREGRDVYEIEHRVVRKDTGEVRFVHEKCRHVRDETGRIIRSAGMVHDVTERKRAETELRRMSEDLTARNLELQAVNKELEAFVDSVSHDLRAPLRSVSGFAKIVLEDYADKLGRQGMDYLSRIYVGSEKMSERIEALMRLTKLSRQGLERSEINLTRLAATLAYELRARNTERDVEVKIAEGLSASADLNLIKLALANLLENAWKFTSKEEHSVIEFGALEQEGGTVYFMKDNGAGFNPAYASGMFLPFHRLHSEGEFEGLGIGLAIVERVIRRHGGKIWAEGAVGKGAIFYFTLG